MIEQKGIKCPSCEDEIYSNSRHDFVSCSCGEVFIDGGFDYIRVGFTSKRPIDISRTLDEKPVRYFREESE